MTADKTSLSYQLRYSQQILPSNPLPLPPPSLHNLINKLLLKTKRSIAFSTCYCPKINLLPFPPNLSEVCLYSQKFVCTLWSLFVLSEVCLYSQKSVCTLRSLFVLSEVCLYSQKSICTLRSLFVLSEVCFYSQKSVCTLRSLFVLS